MSDNVEDDFELCGVSDRARKGSIGDIPEISPSNSVPLCKRSFVTEKSDYFQDVLDEEMKLICLLTPQLKNEKNWATKYENGLSAQFMPEFADSPPEGRQSLHDKAYDEIRTLTCEQMKILIDNGFSFGRLCGGSMFSTGNNWGSPVISSDDIAPYCGLDMSRICAGKISNRTMPGISVNEKEQDCEAAAWASSCLAYNMEKPVYLQNKLDPAYNQEALGLLPYWCACACFNSCVSSGMSSA